MFKKKNGEQKREREYPREPGYPKRVNQTVNVNRMWTKKNYRITHLGIHSIIIIIIDEYENKTWIKQDLNVYQI